MSTDTTATGYPPVDTADRLMGALALHHDLYATLLDALADVYEAGIDAARHAETTAGPAEAALDRALAALGVDTDEAPTVRSEADAAGWDDESGYRCIHHGHEGEQPCPDCHPYGLNLDVARGGAR